MYGIWIEDLGCWMEESRTKDPKMGTYSSNPALWNTIKAAKKEASEYNSIHKEAPYKAKKFN